MSASGFIRMPHIKDENEQLKKQIAVLKRGLVSAAEEHGVCWGLMLLDMEGIISRRMNAKHESLEEALDATWTDLTEIERKRYRRRSELMQQAVKAYKG